MQHVTPISYEDLFSTLFDKLPLIKYDPSWANGTGYFDPAAKLCFPMPCKSVDDSGRQIIFIPNDDPKLGTIIIFKRYRDSNMLKMHVPKMIEYTSGKSRLSTGGLPFHDRDTPEREDSAFAEAKKAILKLIFKVDLFA